MNAKRKPGRPGITDDGAGLAPLPVYSAQTIASVHTGIPITKFREWKAAGCPGFVSNKVALRPTLQWVFSQDRDNGASHKERKEKADADLAEIKVAEARGELVSVAKVGARLEAVFAELRQAILSGATQDELLIICQSRISTRFGLEFTSEANAEDSQDLDPTAEDDSGGMGEQIPLSAS